MATKTFQNVRIQHKTKTSAEWLAFTEAPLKGELCVELNVNEAGSAISTKIKIGDGQTLFKDLAYVGGNDARVIETEVLAKGADHMTAINALAGSLELHAGDIAIAKEKIDDNTDGKIAYTAYVYDGEAWKAMDGNYSADNVYFDADLTYTANIGTKTVPASGSGTISAKGKMLKLAIDGKLSSTIVNNDKETDILAGDISVTQINGSSGISGGIKIENAMPALYSGSKSGTIENVIDSVEKVEDLFVLKNDYDIISSSTWTYAGSNSGGNGEPNGKNCHYISYVCPINPQAIESAKIINPSTGATVATCTGQAELNANTHSTVYHFGNNYNIVIVRPQDGNIFGLQSGAVPFNPWSENLYEGVFLTGPLNETSNFWYIGAINAGGLQSVKVDFGNTPLYVRKPLVKTQYVAASSLTQYKYITHLNTGIKECEILACVENVTINSPWGSLYEGTLGSYSFKTGFFSFEPEIHLEMLNTVTGDESGGVACFIETGIKPTTTSTGTLYAVRPNSGTTAKKIYFKIHAKQV